MAAAARLVVTTCPPEEADRIAGALLERRLVACATALPGGASRYWWKGSLERAAETVLLLKTRADLVPAVEAALRELHPYEVFELLSFPSDGGAADYLRWIAEVTASPAPAPPPRSRPEA